MKTWNQFFKFLDDNNLFMQNVDFSFKNDFDNITPYGPTKKIMGFYHSPDNFYFHFIGNKPGVQVQITPGSNFDKYISNQLFIKIIFSEKEIA